MPWSAHAGCVRPACSARSARTASTAYSLSAACTAITATTSSSCRSSVTHGAPRSNAHRADHLPRQVVAADDVADPDARASASTRGRVNSRMPSGGEHPEPDHGDLVAALEAPRPSR